MTRAAWIDPSDGYPAHDCGGPMVPASLYPQLTFGFLAEAGDRRRALLCLRCRGLVPASGEERLRAMLAARREREAGGT